MQMEHITSAQALIETFFTSTLAMSTSSERVEHLILLRQAMFRAARAVLDHPDLTPLGSAVSLPGLTDEFFPALAAEALMRGKWPVLVAIAALEPAFVAVPLSCLQGQTLLHKCAVAGDLTALQKLLALRADPTVVANTAGRIPLPDLVHRGPPPPPLPTHDMLVQATQLVQYGIPRPDAPAVPASLPLVCTLAAARQRLGGRPLVDAVNSAQVTVLHVAVETGQSVVARWLVSAGRASLTPPAKSTTRHCPTVLQLCVQRKRGDLLAALLGAATMQPTDLEHHGWGGETPLATAVREVSKSGVPSAMVEQLLAAGASVESRRLGDGRTPLMIACSAPHVALVQLLVGQHKASLEGVDCQGNSPFHLAAESGSIDVVRCLVTGCPRDRLGPLLAALNQRGQSVLDVALGARNGQFVAFLVTEGAPMDGLRASAVVRLVPDLLDAVVASKIRRFVGLFTGSDAIAATDALFTIREAASLAAFLQQSEQPPALLDVHLCHPRLLYCLAESMSSSSVFHEAMVIIRRVAFTAEMPEPDVATALGAVLRSLAARTARGDSSMLEFLSETLKHLAPIIFAPVADAIVGALSSMALATPSKMVGVVGVLSTVMTRFGPVTLPADALARLRAMQIQAGIQDDSRTAVTAFLVNYFPALVAVCDICGDNFLASPFHFVRAETGGEHFKKSILCDHFFCAHCLDQWVMANVERLQVHVRCPCASCKFVMYADDVRRVCTPATWARFDALARTNYKTRLSTVRADGFDVWAAANTKLCPSCFLLVERSAGCNSMRCVCGSTFNWESAATLRSVDAVVA